MRDGEGAQALGVQECPWYSPGACPACLERLKKEVWLLRVTVGNPGHSIRFECRTCDYVLPLTYEEIKGQKP